MANANAFTHLTDRCDIYFEGSLISKERIIKKYAEFFVSTLSGGECSVSVALHTGSVCFDIISFVIASLGCLSMDVTTPEEIINSLSVGDMVMYKNERYRWRGVEYCNNKKCLCVEQDGRGKNGKSTRWIPYDINKNLIKPYYGTSELTDGRGVRSANSNRSNFISMAFNISQSEVPSITGVSTVIVTERAVFDRISKGLEIVYDEDKRIELLDIVTAAYYTDSGEEYQFGNNPSKAEPVLKVTGKISTARDLVLDKRGNKVVGLMVIGENALSKGCSELTDLLGRKSLDFIHIAASIESESAYNIINNEETTDVFACTKEYLLQNSLPLKEINSLTSALDRQITNIMNNNVAVVNVDGGLTWDELKQIREALYIIKKSDWSNEKKNDFIISAYSLLNLFTTAVFPLQVLEEFISAGMLNSGVVSPALRIRELWVWAEIAGAVEYTCAYVADRLESLYKSLYMYCPKRDALTGHVKSSDNRRIVIVVPKAYYIDILAADNWINIHNITIVTANRFEGTSNFDDVIVIGDIQGKRFEPLNCKAAENILVFLYECETHLFIHKKRKFLSSEKKLNARIGIAEEDVFDENIEISDEYNKYEELDAFIADTADLEKYIERVGILDVEKFMKRISNTAGNVPTSEVCAVGQFTSGEQILFSKYYDALVFDNARGGVAETDADKLESGDLLVFAKRDDYTQNMVDYIYEILLQSGKFSNEVLDATEKAFYWKEILREYKSINGLSYRDIAKGLSKFGCSLQEVAIRQWLIEESHIVGPRDEKTMEGIAKLTGDSYLLSDSKSYYEACRIVRRQRKEILSLIGRAIMDKLSGRMPPKGSILEGVYENIETLSETLELESITLLEEPITIPVNIINKPIAEVV